MISASLRRGWPASIPTRHCSDLSNASGSHDDEHGARAGHQMPPSFIDQAETKRGQMSVARSGAVVATEQTIAGRRINIHDVRGAVEPTAPKSSCMAWGPEKPAWRKAKAVYRALILQKRISFAEIRSYSRRVRAVQQWRINMRFSREVNVITSNK